MKKSNQKVRSFLTLGILVASLTIGDMNVAFAKKNNKNKNNGGKNQSRSGGGGGGQRSQNPRMNAGRPAPRVNTNTGPRAGRAVPRVNTNTSRNGGGNVNRNAGNRNGNRNNGNRNNNNRTNVNRNNGNRTVNRNNGNTTVVNRGNGNRTVINRTVVNNNRTVINNGNRNRGNANRGNRPVRTNVRININTAPNRRVYSTVVVNRRPDRHVYYRSGYVHRPYRYRHIHRHYHGHSTHWVFRPVSVSYYRPYHRPHRPGFYGYYYYNKYSTYSDYDYDIDLELYFSDREVFEISEDIRHFVTLVYRDSRYDRQYEFKDKMDWIARLSFDDDVVTETLDLLDVLNNGDLIAFMNSTPSQERYHVDSLVDSTGLDPYLAAKVVSFIKRKLVDTRY